MFFHSSMYSFLSLSSLKGLTMAHYNPPASKTCYTFVFGVEQLQVSSLQIKFKQKLSNIGCLFLSRPNIRQTIM